MEAIPGFPGYSATRCGQVIGPRGKALTASYHRRHKHTLVNLYQGDRARRLPVRWLVARAYLGIRPDGLVLVNLDGDGYNNAVDNLAYLTFKEAMALKRERGTHLSGERSPMAKLRQSQVNEARWLYAQGWTLRGIQGLLSLPVGLPTLWNAVMKNTWRGGSELSKS